MARVDMSAGEMIAIAPVEFDGLAYFELGCMYAAGRTVAPDLVTAHKWFNIAAAQGYAAAAVRRSEIAAEMSSGEIAAAQREARVWLTRH